MSLMSWMSYELDEILMKLMKKKARLLVCLFLSLVTRAKRGSREAREEESNTALL
jgi:hypothetical protein